MVEEREAISKVGRETKMELHKVTAEKDIIQLKEQEVSEKLQASEFIILQDLSII